VADSWITICDNAIKSLVFNRWLDCLSITDLDKDTVFCPREQALRKISEKRGNSGDSEFISVWGTPQLALEREHTPTAVRGFEVDMQDGSFQTIKAMPVSLSYEITVWSLSKNNLNKVFENYVWWKFRNPNLSLTLNGIIPLDMDLHFGDASDALSSEYTQGLYYQRTFPLKLDAVLLDLETVELIKTVQLNIVSGFDTTASPTLVDVTLEASG
jgi:hypothetical protein